MVPMLVLDLIFIIQAKNTAYEREISDAGMLADRLLFNYSFELDKAELVVDTLSEFKPLQTYILGDFSSAADLRDYYKQVIHPMIAPHNTLKSGIRLKIYHKKPTRSYAIEMSDDIERFAKENFGYNPFRSGQSFWESLDCYTFHPVLSYFRSVPDSSTYQNVGYVVSAHIKESHLYSYIANESPDERLIIVFNNEGTILTSNDRDLPGKKIGDFLLTDKVPELVIRSEEPVTINGQKRHPVTRSNEILGLCVFISDEKLQYQVTESITQIVIAGFLLVTLSAWLISFITKRITSGMGKLISKMNNVDRVRIHTMAKDRRDDSSHDEIDQLDYAFSKMMRQIDELVDKIKDDERRLTEEVITRQQAELGYLQQQINPHYLFNTLESIRMNLVLKNDHENANIVKIFAESFRRYIDMKNEYTTIYEEMLFIEKYISIQNYRLNNKIKYSLLAVNSIMNLKIPKLLIQPVVENAVIHGIESKPKSGNIRVRIKKTSDGVIIAVEDDGVGMSEVAVEKLKKHVYDTDSEGSIGLKNVYKRLRLVYSEGAKMLIESMAGKGTTVTLIIPVEKNK